MALAKYPSQGQVREYIEDTPREEGESQEKYLRRLLKAIVLAKVQSRVAQTLGIQSCNIANALVSERATLDKMCRMAEAVGCVITLVSAHRDDCTVSHAETCEG